MKEVITMDYTEEVKRVVLGIRDYACMVRYENYPNATIDLIKEAEHRVKSELVHGLKKYFKVEVDENRKTVMAKVHMPFIKDEVVVKLESEVSQLESLLRMRRDEVYKLRNLITNYDSLPWYKRIWSKIK